MPRRLRYRAAEAGQEDKKEDTGRPVRHTRVPARFGQSQATSGDVPGPRKSHRLWRLNDNSYLPTRHQGSDNRIIFKDASDSDFEKPHRSRTSRQRRAPAQQTTGTDKSEAAKSPSPDSESSYGEAPADEVLSFLMQVGPDSVPADFDIRAFLADAPKKKVKKHSPPPPEVEHLPPNLLEIAKEPVPATFEHPHDQIWMAGLVWLHHSLQEGSVKRKIPKTHSEPAKNWCICRGGDMKRMPRSVRCEDPTCSIVWYHWECLSDLERVLAKKHKTWACLRCLFQRALQFFTQFPQSWQKGVTGLEDPAITNELQKIVDDIKLTVERWEMQQVDSDSDYHPEVDVNKPRRIVSSAPRVYVPNGRWSQARSVSPQSDYEDNSNYFFGHLRLS